MRRRVYPEEEKPMDVDKLLEELPKRDVLQIVPAKDWEAVCTVWNGNVLDTYHARIDSWALIEERQPRMSMVVGVTYKYFCDELPECRGYFHKSVLMEQLKPRSPGLPPRVLHRVLRELRIAGEIVTSDYPRFKAAVYDPFNPRLKHKIFDMRRPPDFHIKMRNLPPEDRRIVAIMPATGATALFGTSCDGKIERQPIFVWALVEEGSGAYTVGGIDKERFLCDEWTNFVGYEPKPPKPDEFHKESVDSQ
jgi:hypothetical protein